ncbi:MAG: hypothetical protein OHK0012_01960 [Synechococcales cyanobacterium]
MAKRSLCASHAGIQQAKRSFSLKGWTQENLAAEVNLKTRQPIWRFFTKQPVDRQIFIEICIILDLEWRDIAEDPPSEFPDPGHVGADSNLNLVQLIERVRDQQQDWIQNQCGILQLLDINHPIRLENIYVDTMVLKEVSSQKLMRTSNLEKQADMDSDWAAISVDKQRMFPGIEAMIQYQKIRVLGTVGSGKTTFLKYLAIQCIQGRLLRDYVPIFIDLYCFTERSHRLCEVNLFNYIQQIFESSGIPESISLLTLLQSGKVLLLLDGLDEIGSQNTNKIMREIRCFSDLYHKNIYVASSRTSAPKLSLRGFTDVEIAPLTPAKIETFVQKWFAALTPIPSKGDQSIAAQFIDQLALPSNLSFRHLAVSPLFLHLICLAFQIQGHFPTKRANFYNRILDLLLGAWDEIKGIDRDPVSHEFLRPQKLRFLSQIALITFQSNDHLFCQDAMQDYMSNHLKSITTKPLEAEELYIESHTILKTLETQNGLIAERNQGLFSFSHLAFHEYFTARKIVANHNLGSTEYALEYLVSHMFNSNWQDVFKLTAEMLEHTDVLVQVMTHHLEVLVNDDPYVQVFLTWVSHQSPTLVTPSQRAAIRTQYLVTAHAHSLRIRVPLARLLEQGLLLDIALEQLLLAISSASHPDDLATYLTCCREGIQTVLTIFPDLPLYQSLHQLMEQLPNHQWSTPQFQQWWQEQSAIWHQELQQLITHRHIILPWMFSSEQEQILKRYCEANQLIMDCVVVSRDAEKSIPGRRP